MVKVLAWMMEALSRRPGGTPEAKTVMLGGVPTILEGSAEDPYFQEIEKQAAALDGLAALISKQIPHDSTAIDVGANIGLSTILLARMMDRVIAFEPSPPNVAFLRRNLERNGIYNVEIHAAAVSSQPGTLRFHIAQFGAGSHVVTSGHISAKAVTAVNVPAVMLDQTNLSQIAFIKIDAEGHEPDVLAGARCLLMRDRPLIYTEVNIWCLSAFAGHSPGAFVRKLWEVFEVSKPEANGQISPLPDGYGFLHDTIVHSHGIADLVLRPRAGLPMPSLPELAWPEAALVAIRAAEGFSRTN